LNYKEEVKVDLKEYQELCKLTARTEFKNQEEELSMLGLGIAGEAGDVASCIKKLVFHKNVSIKEGIKENLGDTLWYAAMICNVLEWDLNEVLQMNVNKLKARYPHGFTLQDVQRGGTMIKWSGEGDAKEVGGIDG